jgi:hypothetical protein
MRTAYTVLVLVLLIGVVANLTTPAPMQVMPMTSTHRPVGVYAFGPLEIPVLATKVWIAVDRHDLAGSPQASLSISGEVLAEDATVLTRFTCGVPGGEYHPVPGGPPSLEHAWCGVDLRPGQAKTLQGAVEVIGHAVITGAEVGYEIP